MDDKTEDVEPFYQNIVGRPPDGKEEWGMHIVNEKCRLFTRGMELVNNLPYIRMESALTLLNEMCSVDVPLRQSQAYIEALEKLSAD
jgi:hypothetical protein